MLLQEVLKILKGLRVKIDVSSKSVLF